MLKALALINILVSAIVGGMYWGPYLALTKSLKEFELNSFLAIVNRLNKNMAPLMTVLTPLSLLTTIPVLILSYSNQAAFCFSLMGFLCFVSALFVTIKIEVPIVKQVITWTESTLPTNWQELRDKWGRFHIVRVGCGILGLIFLLVGLFFM